MLASILDPEQPHSIQSSPISVFSDDADQDLPEAAEALPDAETWQVLIDSVPIFANDLADAETVPDIELLLASVHCWTRAHAAEEPSVCLLDRTGSSDEDDVEIQYSNLRSTQNLKELNEHVTGSSTWTSIVVCTLNPVQTSNLLLHTSIQYGDDCSGAKAPYEALCQLVTRLCHEGIASVPIEDMFASECPGPDGDGPRAFIEAHLSPEIMFDTVHRGTDACGMNLRTGKCVLIPTNIIVYCAGWVCRDVSTMNCHRRPLLPGYHRKVVAGKARASSQTLDSSMQYIKTFRPAIALLENIVNHQKHCHCHPGAQSHGWLLYLRDLG